MDCRVPHCLIVSSFQNFLTQKQSPAFRNHERFTITIDVHQYRYKKRAQPVKQVSIQKTSSTGKTNATYEQRHPHRKTPSSKDTLTNSLNTRSYQKRFEEQKNGLQGAPLSSCFLFSKFSDSKAESCVSEITNGLPSRSTYISTDTKNELNR